MKTRLAEDPEFAIEHTAGKVVADLVSARIRAGLTQAEVGKRSGLTQSSIARIESFESGVTIKTLAKYAVAIGASLEVKSNPQVGRSVSQESRAKPHKERKAG